MRWYICDGNTKEWQEFWNSIIFMHIVLQKRFDFFSLNEGIISIGWYLFNNLPRLRYTKMTMFI